MKKAIIIGSGFTGCMLALLLKQKDWSVTVIEKRGVTGGDVRTFFHGGHPYTEGPRHFLSPYPEAYEFLNNIIPLRNIKKINYTYVANDQRFYTYPVHEDDVDEMPEAVQIREELANRSEGAKADNFEEFWVGRIGEILYSKFVKEYNKKAWRLDDNKDMDTGFEATVKVKALESGERYEFKGWYNCYPIAKDGYNRFFDVALDGCEVRLNTCVSGYHLATRTVHIGKEKIQGDIIIMTGSPDELMDYQYGELKYIGRDFLKVILPVEEIFPPEVCFIYYPNEDDLQTRAVEYKKFSLHKSPHTLIGIEVPSLNNKLYPVMKSEELARAQSYFNALPEKVFTQGRMGKYQYVDMDDIILQSFEFVKAL